MSMKILPSNYVALKTFVYDESWLIPQFAYHNVTNYAYFLRSWQFLRNHCKLLQFSITTWSDQEVAFLFQNIYSESL